MCMIMANEVTNNIEETKMSLRQKVLEEIEKKSPNDLDILKSCMEIDQNGHGACSTMVTLIDYEGNVGTQNIHLDVSDFKEKASRFTRNATLKFQLREQILQMDMQFKTAQDPELKLVWDMLEKYGDGASLLSDNQTFSNLVFTLMPDKYIGLHSISMVNPIYWTIEPEIIGISNYNRIRIIFPLERVSVNTYDADDVDLDSIEENVQRSIV